MREFKKCINCGINKRTSITKSEFICKPCRIGENKLTNMANLNENCQTKFNSKHIKVLSSLIKDPLSIKEISNKIKSP